MWVIAPLGKTKTKQKEKQTTTKDANKQINKLEGRGGEGRRGEERRGQDRTGQDRTGQDRTGELFPVLNCAFLSCIRTESL